MKWFRITSISILICLALIGCVNNQQKSWLYPPMAISLQPSLQQEIQLARLNQFLLRDDLNNDIRSKVLFERGKYYDSVGLRDLARIDFNQSLSFNPAQPEIFNLLGIYFTQIGEFDASYEAFESTLELDPAHPYAARNRAIALYYGGREPLALEEITQDCLGSPNDPYCILWHYIIEESINPKLANQHLTARYQDRTNEWGWVLISVMLKKISDEKIFEIITQTTKDNTVLAERLTETYFYLAKRSQIEGDYANALALYKLSLSLNVYEYVEHRYAFLEIGRVLNYAQSIKRSSLVPKS